MRISFVIPAYNEEKNLPKCLDSVARELARTHCDAEVIVVNNASTDRTGELARGYSWVRVVDESRKGLTRARQAGFAASSGDIIANIDSDTVVPEGWLAKVLREFERDERLIALSGPYIYYDLPAYHRALVRLFYIGGYLSHIFNHHLLKGGAMLQGGNFILRREPLEKIGGFDTSIEFYGEDTDIAKRMSKVGKVKWTFALPMYTSGRRLANEGVFRTGMRYAANYFYTLFFGKPLTKTYSDIRS
ncbi:glycosyltransferase family 2 protein [Candidatus Kaiserbacteria bacterium]|nr:glycosyltransferase family 2 protein [Candidatus Kaiserbacteria bacterium]